MVRFRATYNHNYKKKQKKLFKLHSPDGYFSIANNNFVQETLKYPQLLGQALFQRLSTTAGKYQERLSRNRAVDSYQVHVVVVVPVVVVPVVVVVVIVDLLLLLLQ